jgi:hypothetical protein
MQTVLILTKDFGHKANGENMARRRHDRPCAPQEGEPVPQQQFVELGGRLIVDPAEHVAETGLRIDVVQLGFLREDCDRG